MKRVVSFLIIMLLAVGSTCAERVVLGAEQTKEYLPLLKGKRVALLSNHTGLVILGDEAIRRKAKGDEARKEFFHGKYVFMLQRYGIICIYAKKVVLLSAGFFEKTKITPNYKKLIKII